MKSYWNYVPIVICILCGFAIGLYLVIGLGVFNQMSGLSDPAHRRTLMVFGMGLLGASMYSSKFWAIDIDEAVYENSHFLPHHLDFLGYLFTILGGGIVALVLYYLVRGGIGVSTESSEFLELTTEASLVVGFIGGLFTFTIQKRLASLVDNILKEKAAPVAGASSKKNASSKGES